MLINIGVFFMFMSIIKLILQNFQISQKYLEKYDPTFIFVGSYFAERLWGKVCFFKGWELCPTILSSRSSNIIFEYHNTCRLSPTMYCSPAFQEPAPP